MRRLVLRSARLEFREWTIDDLPLAEQLWGDPEVTRLIGGPFSKEQIRARLEHEIASELQYWPIFRADNGDHIGCCGLRPYDGSVYELGVHLRREHWGHGYASEAARCVIEHAFTTLGASALFAGHHPANDASRRLLASLGFEYVRDELYAPTGLLHPSYLLKRVD